MSVDPGHLGRRSVTLPRVRIAIAGTRPRVAQVSAGLSRDGIEAIEMSTAGTDWPAGFGKQLLEFERRLDDERGSEITAVVLVDRSDTALAAALVAAKVPLPIVVLERRASGGDEVPDANARVIDQLSTLTAADDVEAIRLAVETASDRRPQTG